MSTTTSSAKGVAAAVAVVAGVGIGLFLRVDGTLGGFWLDEIWSLVNLREIHAPIEILTRLHTDNNHILNSLFLYAVGERSWWPLYRLPSLISSVIALPMVWLLTRERGKFTAACSTLFFSLSYIMILYGSEARGYALMITFCLLALWFARAILRGKSRVGPAWLALGLWGSAVLGLLSHLTFLHFYLALIGWSGWAALRLKERRRRRALVAAHVACLACYAAIYAVHSRHLPPGSGPIYSYVSVLVDSASVAFGGPALPSSGDPGRAALAVALFGSIMAVSLVELFLLWRERSSVWLLYSLAIFVAPSMTLILLHPDVVFVRYFIVGIACLYLLTAGFVGRVAGLGPAGRVAAVLIVLAFCAGQATYLTRFLAYGRGDYNGAIEYMVRHTPDRVLRISSDHPFRNGLVLLYHQRFFPGVRMIHRQYSGVERPPDWWLAHRLDPRDVPPDTIRVGGQSYRLQASYPHAALSGMSWYVYRRSP